MTTSVIDISDLWFTYNGQPVLENINLDIHRGDFIAMIGPNGGGKTTLLKLMLGLLQPSKGTVRILGNPPSKATHQIGYVPQDVNINRNFPITALDVVLMGKMSPGNRWKHNRTESVNEAMAALERMEMSDFAHRKIGELSGGQRQRIFIARALVTSPQLLLLDEPMASVDSRGQNEFYRLLKELNSDITVIVVSHDLLVISGYVKSIACVNKRLHYHNQSEITGEMLEEMYPCTVEDDCPVELVMQGLLKGTAAKQTDRIT